MYAYKLKLTCDGAIWSIDLDITVLEPMQK